MREWGQICTTTLPFLQTTQASCLSDKGSLGPLSCLRSQVHDRLSRRQRVPGVCVWGGENVDVQLLPLYGSFWGRSSPRSGFRTGSPGPSCTGWSHPAPCAAHWHRSLRSGEAPARFHTWKRVKDFLICHTVGETVTHQWSNARDLGFRSGRFCHGRHFQTLLHDSYYFLYGIFFDRRRMRVFNMTFRAIPTLYFMAKA